MTEEDIYMRVSEILVDYLRLEPSEITPDSHIVNDIGADSLAMVEPGFKFSEAFGVGMMAPTDENLVVGNLVRQIQREMGS
jgi:acyl carrier protein